MMTLEKAIEIMEREVNIYLASDHTVQANAIKLLIEAGKYIIYRDNCPGINTRLLLPGETEE